MIIVNYIASRSIQSGHIAGVGYTFAVNLTTQDRDVNVIGDENTAINGNTVTVIRRTEVSYSFTTELINNSTNPTSADLLEFLDSVSHGEVFSLEIDSVPTVCKMSIKKQYAENREDPYFRYNFSVKAI